MRRRTSVRVRITVGVLLWLAAAAGRSEAQVSVDSFASLPTVLAAGELVDVEDSAGRHVKGTIRAVTDSELTLTTTGVLPRNQVFAAGQLRSVSRVDSRKEGLLVGFAAGAVPGIWLGSMFNSYCYNESPHHCPGAIVALGALSGALGGWIGWTIDGGINRDVVFAASHGPTNRRIGLSPVLSPRSAGLLVSATF
jgi:hypothetical protein